MIRPSAIARHSSRLEQNESTRVLDVSTRNRRLQRQLEVLEQDNCQEDPHANLVMHKAAPKFDENDLSGSSGPSKPGRKRAAAAANAANDSEDSPAGATKKKRKFRHEHNKTRFRKNFLVQVAEENERNRENPELYMAYEKAAALPSSVPPRFFCTSCGVPAKYTCIRCGSRYCSIPCRDSHTDTRCLKWAA